MADTRIFIKNTSYKELESHFDNVANNALNIRSIAPTEKAGIFKVYIRTNAELKEQNIYTIKGLQMLERKARQ